MRRLTGQIQTSDGLTLQTRSWMPEGDPKGMIALVHGQAEHSQRYDHVGVALTDAGYGLHMADLRGHGHSPGARGHIMAWNEYHCDAATIMQQARDMAPDAAHFLAGHSLGGLIALSVAVDNPPGYAGVVTSAPALRVAFEPPAWKATVGRLLSGLLPELSMSNELNTSDLSHEQAIVAAYEADPLVHGKVTARFFAEFMAAGESTLAAASNLRLPLLIQHGSADAIASTAASREFYENAGAEDKTIKIYDGLFHEIYNEKEPDRSGVLADLIAWLDAHLT